MPFSGAGGLTHQNIWRSWVLELVETLGFVPRLAALLRANVSALSLLRVSSITSLSGSIDHQGHVAKRSQKNPLAHSQFAIQRRESAFGAPATIRWIHLVRCIPPAVDSVSRDLHTMGVLSPLHPTLEIVIHVRHQALCPPASLADASDASTHR